MSTFRGMEEERQKLLRSQVNTILENGTLNTQRFEPEYLSIDDLIKDVDFNQSLTAPSSPVRKDDFSDLLKDIDFDQSLTQSCEPPSGECENILYQLTEGIDFDEPMTPDTVLSQNLFSQELYSPEKNTEIVEVTTTEVIPESQNVIDKCEQKNNEIRNVRENQVPILLPFTCDEPKSQDTKVSLFS